MKRGDIVTVAMQGDYGKPRPAVVVQSDLMDKTKSIALIPFTSHILESASQLRVTVEPSGSTGLKKTSDLMIDKIMTVRREKVRDVIGVLDEEKVSEMNKKIIVFLGIA